MERSIEAKDILQHMEVPSLPGVFVLGSFEQRITFYSQQVRALNLVYALSDQGRLSSGSRVLIIGAGAAGLTAAAAAGLLGARVMVLEKEDEVMPLLRGNTSRWLHPHIYEWPAPDAEDPHAHLPLLDWHAGLAGDVVRKLEAQWEELRERLGIELHKGVDNLNRTGSASNHAFTWDRKREEPPHGRKWEAESFDLVVLAVGFGREKPPPGVESRLYWANDDLHQLTTSGTRRVHRHLISGTGDGGLVDLLRVRLRDFRHDHVVKDFLSGPDLETVKHELLKIEDEVTRLSPYELFKRYQKLRSPTVDKALLGRLRTETSAVLNSREPFPLSPRACVLNRFLASRLLQHDVNYRSGDIDVCRTEKGSYLVSFGQGEPEEVDRLVIRHGPTSALEASCFSWLDRRGLEEIRARSQLDQTRVPRWPKSFFESQPSRPTASPSVSPPPSQLPPESPCFGREELLSQLVEELLSSNPRPTTVLGPPGIGKSTLTLAALHAPNVRRRYGPRRYFIRLDGANTAATLNSTIAQELGLPAGPDLPARMETFFGGRPALLVLDNAETPWEGDPQAVEALLAKLASISRLALVLSVRGRRQPPFPRESHPIEVPVLEPDAARRLFLNIAWNIARDNPHHPHLDEMLEAQQGLALAISLLAHAAQGAELEGTYQEWRQLRSSLLERKESPDRLGSITVSFELSLQSPRVSDEARRLLSVLSSLPAGVARGDLESLFPGGVQAASVLEKAGLVFSEAQRLRTLAPIREYIQRKHPPRPVEWARVAEHYTELARSQGPQVGRAKGAAALTRLVTEMPNLDVVLQAGLEEEDARSAIDTLLALNNFVRFSGYGALHTLEQARKRAEQIGDESRLARSTYALGQILLRRSQDARAEALIQQALPLFERQGNLEGQARCIHSLGSIALDRLELEKARECFERAIALRHQLKNQQGIGNCLHGLGKVALSHGQREDARDYFEKAFRLFEEIDDDLGRAYCLRSLGELDANPRQLERARELFKKVGYLRGQGHCLRSMGDIALQHAQVKRAAQLYSQALRPLRQVGSVRGVANCLQGRGRVALEQGALDKARHAFQQALKNYRQVNDKRNEEECLRQLARLNRGLR
jgi:tetratricopeptide (TPR) repeat protein